MQKAKASSEDRTRDLSLTKRMLCHLSYRGWWGGWESGVSRFDCNARTFLTTSPGFGDCAWLLWRSWQRVGLIIPRSRVRSSPGALLFLFQLSLLPFPNTVTGYRHRADPGDCFPNSLVGQDMWFSPTRPGFESRLGNTFLHILLCKSFVEQK